MIVASDGNANDANRKTAFSPEYTSESDPEFSESPIQLFA
jgi:hypothetical protein